MRLKKTIMLKKITNLLPAIISRAKLSLGGVSGSVKLIATLYIVFSALILVSYVALFFYEYHGGRTTSADLLPFIEILIGSSMIAFVTFILGLCLDRDHDGVPDAIDPNEKEG